VDTNKGNFSSGWGLDARLTTLLCKQLLLRNPKKRNLDQTWQNLLRKAKKVLFLPMMMMIIIIIMLREFLLEKHEVPRPD
jgi:hypothetical protein